MITNPPNSTILASIPDSQLALEKKKLSSRDFINDRLFDLERQIAQKCKSFSHQITIEPLKAERRFTHDFFGNSEPLTPVSNKTMTIAHAYEIQIIDGNTTCETMRVNNDNRNQRPSIFSTSMLTSVMNLHHLNSISPEEVQEEKPILEINIERYSNSLSQKQESPPTNHVEELKKLEDEKEKANKEFERIKEEILILKNQSKLTLDELTVKKNRRKSSDRLSPTATQVETPLNFCPRRLEELEERRRKDEERLYVYEKIFTRIYNIIHQNPMIEDEPGAVAEIKTRRYLKVEEDLKEMFESVKVLDIDIKKYEVIKRNMENEVLWLDNRITELQKKVAALQKQEKSLITERTFKCQFEINSCQDSSNIDQNQINDKTKQKLAQINSLYDVKIQLKYKEMIELKMEKENIVREALQSEHSQFFRKKVEVLHQITDVDRPVQQDGYVKRVLTRKVKISKNVQTLLCDHMELHSDIEMTDKMIEELIAANSSV